MHRPSSGMPRYIRRSDQHSKSTDRAQALGEFKRAAATGVALPRLPRGAGLAAVVPGLAQPGRPTIRASRAALLPNHQDEPAREKHRFARLDAGADLLSHSPRRHSNGKVSGLRPAASLCQSGSSFPEFESLAAAM